MSRVHRMANPTIGHRHGAHWARYSLLDGTVIDPSTAFDSRTATSITKLAVACPQTNALATGIVIPLWYQHGTITNYATLEIHCCLDFDHATFPAAAAAAHGIGFIIANDHDLTYSTYVCLGVGKSAGDSWQLRCFSSSAAGSTSALGSVPSKVWTQTIFDGTGHIGSRIQALNSSDAVISGHNIASTVDLSAAACLMIGLVIYDGGATARTYDGLTATLAIGTHYIP